MIKIIGVILSACLLLIALVVWWPSSTSEPTPTPEISGPVTTEPNSFTPGFTTHTDPYGSFNISYPSDWELGQLPTSGNLFTASLNDYPGHSVGNITIAVSNPPESYSDIFQYAEEMLVNVLKRSPELFAVHEVYPITIQGLEAAIVEFDTLNSGVIQSHILLLVTLAHDQLWAVTCSSNSELFVEYREDFYKLIGSLQILGAASHLKSIPVPAMPSSVAITSTVQTVQAGTPTSTQPTQCEIERDMIQAALGAYHELNGMWPTEDGLPGDIVWENLVPDFLARMPVLDKRCDWHVNSYPEEGKVCLLTPC